jgi:hypothetical protein
MSLLLEVLNLTQSEIELYQLEKLVSIAMTNQLTQW